MKYIILFFLIICSCCVYSQTNTVNSEVTKIACEWPGEGSSTFLRISKDSSLFFLYSSLNGKPIQKRLFLKTPDAVWKTLLSITDTLNWEHTKDLISKHEKDELTIDGAIMTQIDFYSLKTIIHSIKFVSAASEVKILNNEILLLIDRIEKKGKRLEKKFIFRIY